MPGPSRSHIITLRRLSSIVTQLTKMDLVSQRVTFETSGKVAPNRILKSAMTERLCSWAEEAVRGKPTAEYLQLYETWSAGEIGE